MTGYGTAEGGTPPAADEAGGPPLTAVGVLALQFLNRPADPERTAMRISERPATASRSFPKRDAIYLHRYS